MSSVGSLPDEQIGTIWQWVDRFGSVGQSIYLIVRRFDFDEEHRDNLTGEVWWRAPLYEAVILGYPYNDSLSGHTCRLFFSGSKMWVPATGSVMLERVF